MTGVKGLWQKIRKPSLVIERVLAIVLVVAFGIMLFAGLRVLWDHLQGEEYYRKDLLQDYLSAQAILNQEDPYEPLGTLLSKYVPSNKTGTFSHPNPHPLSAVVLVLPLSLFGFDSMAFSWLLFEIVCLAAGTFLLLRNFIPDSSSGLWIFSTLLAFSAQPIIQELVVGQLHLLLFLGAVFMLVSFQNDRLNCAGLALGAMLSIKLFAWPFLLFWFFRRKWAPLFLALFVFASSQVFSLYMLGLDGLRKYYFEILPAVSKLYQPLPNNISIWSTGQRLFGGLSSVDKESVFGPALVEVPGLVVPFGIICFVFFFAWIVSLALRSQRSVAAYSILLIGSVILNPISWVHGFSVAMIFPFVAVYLLREQRFPEPESWLAVAVTFLIFIGSAFSGPGLLGSLLTGLPIFTVLLAVWTLYRIDKKVFEIESEEQALIE